MYNGDATPATEQILRLRNYPRQPEYLLAALEDVAAHFGEIPEAARNALFDYFGIDGFPDEISATLFHQHIVSAKRVTVCAGPICRREGSDLLADKLSSETDLVVERQHCMGACDQAPCAIANGNSIPSATPASILAALG